MIRNIFLVAFLVVFIGASFASDWDRYFKYAEGSDWKENEPSKLNRTVPYCYHFTWMGRKFNNDTFKNIRNKTCNQYFKDKKTLCINPMVATFTGRKPDLGYILQNHPKEATCRLTTDHVCVKYVAYYNGIISYETRYCSIVNIENEGPMRKGCIKQVRGSETVEVCACESQPGPDGICNSSPSSPQVEFFLLFIVFLTVYI